MPDAISVLIVDDHFLVRSGLEAVLAIFDDLAVAGKAESGEDAVRLSCELRPDVVLMDLVMPGMGGVAATREILSSCPGTRVLALTTFTEEGLVEETLRAGAIGYLMKDVNADELAAAIRAAHAGRATLAPQAADALVQAIGGGPGDEPETLTRREREVLVLLAQGLSNSEIAQRLRVKASTVKTHVSRIIGKLGVSTRTEAAALAIRSGLV